MSIRATSRTTGETTLPPGFGDSANAAEYRAAARRVFEGQDELDAGARDTLPITEILRGLNLDALLHGGTGSEFLYAGWAVELPVAPGSEDLTRLADLQVVIDKESGTALVLPDISEPISPTKDADIAQVLPGIMGDEFLLSKDADLPLVLPGDEGDVGALDANGDAEALVSFPSHMLTLHPEGGFAGETDDLGRLHDHDGWLF